MIANFFRLVFRGLRYRSLRSWLTVLGIVIGIMLVVVILAIGNGVQHVIQGQLQMFGSDLVIIYPGKENSPLIGFIAGQKFREQDLTALEKIDGVGFVLATNQGVATVEYRGEKQSTMLHAENWKHYIEILEKSQGIRLKQGRYPTGDDVDEVVVGSKFMSSLFRTPVHIGDEITVKSKHFKVVGFFSDQGEASHNSAIFLSLNQFNILNNSRGASTAIVKVRTGYDLKTVAQEIKFQLGKQDVVRDFAVITPDKINQIVGNVLSVIELMLMIIALVSLLVGGVGIMNTMYTSVLERTKQIGVMKAIGATDEAVLTLFLIEAGMIGIVGGLLGILLGLLSAYGIGAIAASQGVRGLFDIASVDYFGLFALIVFTFIVGVVAGYFPARAGAKLEPAEALRYE